MRRATGAALLARSPQLQPGGPSLSSLVERLAANRGVKVVDRGAPAVRHPAASSLSLPLMGLVTPPPTTRRLEAASAPVAGLALLGAHGGAGVSSLLRAGLDEVAVDAGRRWPMAGAVVLVARTSVCGLEWARDLARQHASGSAGGAELLGLVLVPDAPGRLPARITGLRDLVTGAFARTWRLPWLEEWRLATATEVLPSHPAVQHLTAELAGIPQQSHPQLPHPHLSDLHLSPTTGTTRPRGDLL